MDGQQIKPIFFPFTCISKPVLEDFMTCFNQVTIYLPSSGSADPEMKELSGRGMLDLRTPVEKDEDKLDALYQDCLSWADLHRKTGIKSFRNRKDTPPLFDSTRAARIKSDILNYSKHKTEEGPDPEFTARLFLKQAQAYDRHQYEMNQGVRTIERLEQELFTNLKGRKTDPYSNSSRGRLHDSEDTGAFMTEERIGSWSRIMRHDADPPSGIFITSSAAVWGHMIDSSPEAQVIGNHIALKPAGSRSENFHEGLPLFLDKLQRENRPSANLQNIELIQNKISDREISLSISIIPDQTPYDYFSRFLKRQLYETKKDLYNSAFTNTILVLLS